MGSRVAVAGVVAVVAVVVLRVGVAPAESCPTVSVADTRAAAEAAVEWFAANQHEDGSFAYLLDDDGRDLGGYSVTRHAGVLLSLYQAVSAGIDDALPVAESGREWATAQIVDAGTGRALGGAGTQLQTGASALLVAALVERRAATGDDGDDALIADVAGFLGEAVEPSGAVPEAWDSTTERAVPDSYSVFSTGEVLWALALTGRPEAEAVAAYMPRRDDVEDRFPPTSDHWAAYAWAELAAQGTSLSDEQWDHADRLADIFGVQVRTESTRWTAEGPVKWMRRGPAGGSGVGTLGEGTAALLRLYGSTTAATASMPVPDGLAERAACVAGMLVGRQEDGPGPGQRGAWFAGGVTRMDDQQHALSALLAAEPALEAAGAAETEPVGEGEDPWGLAVVVLALLAAANPARHTRPTGSARLVVAGAYAAVVVLAALSGPVADLLSLSPASVRLAAGSVLLVVSAAELVTPAGDWLDGLAVAATVVVTLAAGLDNGVLLVLAAAIPAAAAALWLPDAWRRPLTARLVAAIGAAVAISLVVEGVLGV